MTRFYTSNPYGFDFCDSEFDTECKDERSAVEFFIQKLNEARKSGDYAAEDIKEIDIILEKLHKGQYEYFDDGADYTGMKFAELYVKLY